MSLSRSANSFANTYVSSSFHEARCRAIMRITKFWKTTDMFIAKQMRSRVLNVCRWPYVDEVAQRLDILREQHEEIPHHLLFAKCKLLDLVGFVIGHFELVCQGCQRIAKSSLWRKIVSFVDSYQIRHSKTHRLQGITHNFTFVIMHTCWVTKRLLLIVQCFVKLLAISAAVIVSPYAEAHSLSAAKANDLIPNQPTRSLEEDKKSMPFCPRRRHGRLTFNKVQRNPVSVIAKGQTSVRSVRIQFDETYNH